MSLNLHNTLMALSSALLMLVVALMLAAPASDAAGDPKQHGDAGAQAPLALAGTPGPVLVAVAHRVEPEAAPEALPRATRSARRPDIRSAIALPYFSFAQGLRRGKGG